MRHPKEDGENGPHAGGVQVACTTARVVASWIDSRSPTCTPMACRIHCGSVTRGGARRAGLHPGLLTGRPIGLKARCTPRQCVNHVPERVSGMSPVYTALLASPQAMNVQALRPEARPQGRGEREHARQSTVLGITSFRVSDPVHPVYPCSLLREEMETWMDRIDRISKKAEP